MTLHNALTEWYLQSVKQHYCFKCNTTTVFSILLFIYYGTFTLLVYVFHLTCFWLCCTWYTVVTKKGMSHWFGFHFMLWLHAKYNDLLRIRNCDYHYSLVAAMQRGVSAPVWAPYLCSCILSVTTWWTSCSMSATVASGESVTQDRGTGFHLPTWIRPEHSQVGKKENV